MPSLFKLSLICFLALTMPVRSIQTSDRTAEPAGFMVNDHLAPPDIFREIKPASLTQMTSFQDLPQLGDDSGAKTKQGAENNLFGMIGLGLVVWLGFSNLRQRRRT